MPLRTDIYYRDLAGDAVRNAGLTEPPVDVRALAEHLGIPVRTAMLPEFFYGALIAEDGLPVVVINAKKEQVRQRDTLAHIIGHLLTVLDDAEAMYPRDAGEHRVADIIAAELVAPTFMVSDQARKWFNDYRYMARLFGVTESGMLDRMKALGLIKDRGGIYWDY